MISFNNVIFDLRLHIVWLFINEKRRFWGKSNPNTLSKLRWEKMCGCEEFLSALFFRGSIFQTYARHKIYLWSESAKLSEINLLFCHFNPFLVKDDHCALQYLYRWNKYYSVILHALKYDWLETIINVPLKQQYCAISDFT